MPGRHNHDPKGDFVRITIPQKEIRVFTISPRTLGLEKYWKELQETVTWSGHFNCTGILIFTGNDTYIDPWLVAQMVLEKTSDVSPLIAVNPVYMHPFTAAKMISSFAHLYQRRVYLNMVTGTAISHLEALGDSVSHDDRYQRLQEYVQIIRSLLEGSRPVTFHGRFYTVDHLQLYSAFPKELLPEFVLAGQSPAARSACDEIAAVGMHMLQSRLADAVAETRGIHFGMIARPDDAAAWKAAQRLFPPDSDGKDLLDLSMRNTDSAWKRRMRFEADQPDVSASGYWLEPFRNSKADCPYFVGSYTRTAELIANLIRRGVDTFILDIPALEEEYAHASEVFKLAERQLRSSCESAAVFAS
jgi:alkanesulfonate monooxygenase